MKFLHLGDLHIGKNVNDFNMIDDQRYILQQILDMIKTENADALLIAGDVYDKAIPSEEAVRVFDSFLAQLAAAQIPTFVISGNHDSDERLHFGSSLFEKSRIYIHAVFDGPLQPYELEDAYGTVRVYLLPFIKASQVRRYFPEETIESYEDAVRVILEHSHIDPEKRNILVAHQFVCGHHGEIQLAGSENLAVQHVGTVEQIGCDLFDAFDYAALGHIHSSQKIGREEVRYSGSPLAYSQSEIGQKKSVPMIELKEKGEIELSFLPLVPKRQMRQLRGKLKHLIDPANVTDTDDYIYVTLTDEDPIPNVINIIREYYPNLMKLEYDNSHSKEVAQVDLQNITRGKTFTELITEFYRKMYGSEISEEELEIMREVAGEAGVAYEAD
ncbi:MAG: exonuclease SbcCD subunit D [Eubacteriales bacterium]|nr:exonuclease SbcCD subunit D [Eubacteriales bacterium]